MSEDQFQNEIVEEKASHHYRAEIPKIVYHLKLTPYELAVYNILKSTAGDNGSCYKSNETLASEAGVSVRTFQQVKKSLCLKYKILGDRPLIKVQKRVSEKGGNLPDFITIIDIWDCNYMYFINLKKKNKSLGEGASHAQGGVHQMHEGGAPNAPKEDHSKKIYVDVLIDKEKSNEKLLEKEKDKTEQQHQEQTTPSVTAPVSKIYYEDLNCSQHSIAVDELISHLKDFKSSIKDRVVDELRKKTRKVSDIISYATKMAENIRDKEPKQKNYKNKDVKNETTSRPPEFRGKNFKSFTNVEPIL